MTGLRAWLHTHRSIAALVIAAALLVRLLVPAGFMPGAAPGTLIVQLCSGVGGTMVTIEIPGLAKKDAAHQSAAKPCAFSDLYSPALPAADAVLAVLSLLAAFALAMLPLTLPAVRRRAYLQPPPRGPPAFA